MATPIDFRALFDDFPADLSETAYRSDAFWTARTATALLMSRLSAAAYTARHGEEDPQVADALDDVNERAQQALDVLEHLCAGRRVAVGRVGFLRGMIGGHVRDTLQLRRQLSEDAAALRLSASDAWLAGMQYWGYWSVVLSCDRHVTRALRLPSADEVEARWRRLHEEIDRHASLSPRVATSSLTDEDRDLLAAMYRRWAAFVDRDLVPEVQRRGNL